MSDRSRNRRNTGRRVLVSADALPDALRRVLDAKAYLHSGAAETAAEAARMAGISRATLYKYRDAVFPYDEEDPESFVTVNLLLQDRPGVLSAVLSAFAEAGANIVTVHQKSPAGDAASVSIVARVHRLERPLDDFLHALQKQDGVLRLAHVPGGSDTSALHEKYTG